ncbi:MAG TPA: TolC family protein [Nitrosomonas sp.]|uniref:Outer membrane protein, cobalt-zinc-cadmium efflux system n=1 Tax=Nitrosomonas aestuarii TaxID=52441 RepID=A0A1I4H6L5_9PROT|nr:TolC family protein [Nitrosomonas aestuarii]SFL37400.1 outer membrane protein, cobalt-zinc-cadmium efflux system [Nitrosomonas aestuarii]HBV20957.1 TolC family protein [Nitrosomonas sp.]
MKVCLFRLSVKKNWVLSLIASVALIGCAASPNKQNLSPKSQFFPEMTSSFPGDSTFQEVNPASTSHLSDQTNNVFLTEDEPLSLEKLQQLARQYNPTLVQAWTHVESERAKALQASLYPNPVIGYSGDQVGVNNTIGEFQGGFIRQEFVTGGKLELSRQKYLARASAAELQALVQEYRVTNGIVIQFYRLLGLQKKVKIQQELSKNWQDNLLTVKEMFNIGQANEADIHQANVQLQQQQLRLQVVENELQLEKERLISFVGTHLPPNPVSGNLVENLTPLNFEEALQRLLRESPELGMVHANVKSDEIMVQREKAEPIPNINVQFSAGRNYAEQDAVYGVLAFIKVPLFDWNQGAIQQAQADLRRQKAQIRLTELQLRQRLAEQFQQYLTAVQHIQNYKDIILPESEQRYKTQLLSYKAARETWPAVLESQRDFFMRRLEYVDQLIAWRTARVAIDGMLLTDGLQTPQNVTPAGHIDATPKPR